MFGEDDTASGPDSDDFTLPMPIRNALSFVSESRARTQLDSGSNPVPDANPADPDPDADFIPHAFAVPASFTGP